MGEAGGEQGATFVLTDVEGSTRLWEIDPAAMRPAMARHDEIIDNAVVRHGGSVIRSRGEGDSSFSVFESAADAIAAAVDLQRGMAAEPWPGEVTLRVRLGIHTGEAEHRAGDYYGTAVNRCARLRGIAYGGQSVLSTTTRALVEDRLPPGAFLRDLGPHRLKDLADPERIYQLCHPDLVNEFPPLRGLEALPNNLPIQLTSFVGRERELRQLRERVLHSRLLTLTGTGGCGKTRLALEVAADLTDDYEEVWLVELDAIGDPAGVPAAVAAVLGVRERSRGRRGRGGAGQPDDVVDGIIEHLGRRRVLVILDNSEHLLAACAALVEVLLQNCPGLAVLATSREPLGAPGEVTWRVPSLPVPDVAHLPGLEEFRLYDSVRLFVDRARHHQLDFALTAENQAAVAQICSRVDGIPLALELAAARVTALTTEQIATRLSDQYALLTGGARTALSRQQTLRAAVDWSYLLLDAEERLLLERLGVFAGGFGIEDVEGVCAGDDLPAGRVLDLITRLVDKSLVLHERQREFAPYRLLLTIRQYAIEKLRESGSTDTLHERHRDYYRELATRGSAEIRGVSAPKWLELLTQEHDNLRAALEWSIAARDPAGLRIAADLRVFWLFRGYLAEGRRWLQAALDHCVADSPDVLVKALSGAGRLALEQGDYAAARSLHERALELAQRSFDREAAARSLRYLGQVAYFQYDFSGARGLLEMALAEARATGTKPLVALTLVDLAVTVGTGLEDYESAVVWAAEGLEIARVEGDQRNTANALFTLGEAAMTRGDIDAALKLFDSALAASRQAGDKRTVSDVLLRRAVALTASGRREDAVRSRNEAFDLVAELDTPEILVDAAHYLARQLGPGQPADAARLLASAERARAAWGSFVAPVQRAVEERLKADLKRALGADRFDELWSLGSDADLKLVVGDLLAGEAAIS